MRSRISDMSAAAANSTGSAKLGDRVEDRRAEAVDARAARRRRSRLISLGDFGSLLAIRSRRGSTLFGEPDSDRRARPTPAPPAVAISRRRRRSGDVRASSAEAPRPVIRATDTNRPPRASHSSGVMTCLCSILSKEC